MIDIHVCGIQYTNTLRMQTTRYKVEFMNIPYDLFEIFIMGAIEDLMSLEEKVIEEIDD
jgi:hypothetical protein